MAKPQKIIGVNPKRTYRENANIILPQKVAEVYSWEQFIYDPENHEQLHNMRISVKRLRYTMEFFAVNYGRHFIEFIDTIIKLQDLLGDIHDGDVVLDILTEYKNNRLSTNMQGIDTLISRTRKTRDADYKNFLKKWKQMSTTNFKQKLLTFIES